jgi:hypothetical protein
MVILRATSILGGHKEDMKVTFSITPNEDIFEWNTMMRK